MTKNQTNYWQKRYLQEKDRQLTNSAEYESAMQARLQLVEQDLEKEVHYWLQRYANNQNTSVEDASKILNTIGTTDWHMTLDEFEAKAKTGFYDKELDAEYFKSRLSRLQNINDQLTNLLKQSEPSEANHFEAGLKKQFQDTYMHTIFNTQVQQAKLSNNFARFNENQLKQVVSKPWQGSNFSKRIWKNYTELLPNQLVDALLRGTVLGYSEPRIFKMFRQRFKNVEDNQIHRLVITEMGHVAEQATAKAYQESGIDQYEYLATLESHTCEECAHLDGKIFDVKDEKDGINYPLIHPYCRCTTMPYMKDLPGLEQRWMRDPETGKSVNIEDMKFSEWKKLFVDKIFKRTKESGAKFDDWYNNQEIIKQDNIAKKLYSEFVNRNKDFQIKLVAKNTGFSPKQIQKVYEHIFINEHLFSYGQIHKFDPDYDMAQSWNRLASHNKHDIQKHDILMLEHELYESILMSDGTTTYKEAHDRTQLIYDYRKALEVDKND